MIKNISNNKFLFLLLLSITLISVIACKKNDRASAVQIINLYEEGGSEKFHTLREIFKDQNPGYNFDYLAGVKTVETGDFTKVIFVQEIEGKTNQEVSGIVTITDETGAEELSKVIVGDIILLERYARLQTDIEMGLLAFQVPIEPSRDLPAFIRPDWDPNITDVPGGCATEIDAYRRILLTWSKDVGEYIYHALNAHRVRIYDSFSHFHPVDGGFDEFYLVQMAEPGAKIIISEKVDLIKNPDHVARNQLDDIIEEYELNVGDLVYIPKGVMHRGVGGVLAQVITIPGFIPGTEIGVDHHLRSINERFDLSEEELLPFNEEHSHKPVVR